MSELLAHLNRDKLRRILNILVEAPFFYDRDDPELFAYLRRYRADFRRFYEELYGWELVIDEHTARLYKPRWYNRALLRSAHDVFDLTRRDQCIAFLLVLEFYEHLLDEQNTSIDDTALPRFRYGELFRFAALRLAEELGQEAPNEGQAGKLLRELMPTLLRYRFLREIAPERDIADSVTREDYIYECLPALHLYDVNQLGARPLLRMLGAAGGDAVSQAVSTEEEE